MEEPKAKKISIGEGISTEINGDEVTLSKGGKTLKKKFDTKEVFLKKEGNGIAIFPSADKKKINAIVNAIASEIRNMEIGLTKGFEYKMEIIYSHFPMNVSLKGRFVEVSNVGGAKSPRRATIVGDDTKVEIKGKEVVVKGIDKEAVGQTCANLEKASKIKNKDVRIFQDGIYILNK